jgi:hypothetical protein
VAQLFTQTRVAQQAVVAAVVAVVLELSVEQLSEQWAELAELE